MSADVASQSRSNYQSPSYPITTVSKSTIEERSVEPHPNAGSRSVILQHADSQSESSKGNNNSHLIDKTGKQVSKSEFKFPNTKKTNVENDARAKSKNLILAATFAHRLTDQVDDTKQ